jgi:demethylmenaquinone methyltransferase/2-methoxy-6-polyprenyl-1,4-benzoquinol methylase
MLPWITRTSFEEYPPPARPSRPPKRRENVQQSDTPTDPNTEGEGARTELVESLFHGTGDTYAEIAHLATWGRDKKWKEELLSHLHEPKKVLDLACGTGLLALEMAHRFGCHVTGVELRAEYLDICRQRAEKLGLDVTLIHANAEEVEVEGQFDHITSCYIPKYVDLHKVVPPMAALLAPGGLMIFQDFAYPTTPWVRDVFDDHFDRMRERCKHLPDWNEVWELLPDVLKESTWIEDTAREMRESGLEDVRIIEQSLGMSAMVLGRRPSA